MRLFYPFFTLIFICLLPQVLVAQCIADAGPDQHACMSMQGGDTLTLGGSPAASGGAAPYTYRWSYINTSSFSVSAADFLNDTTVANPEYQASGWSDTMRFVLQVTDSNGINCRDTVVVTKSVFGSHLGSFPITITEGDTLTLPVGPNVFSNFPTASVVWRPQHGMIDSTSLQPTVAPTRNTNYYPVITDSMGCTMKGAAFVLVTVNPLGDKEHLPQQGIAIFPNPARDVVQIQLGSSTGEVRVAITDLSGRVVDKFATQGQAVISRRLDFPAGAYLVNIYQENQRLGVKKLVVKE